MQKNKASHERFIHFQRIVNKPFFNLVVGMRMIFPYRRKYPVYFILVFPNKQKGCKQLTVCSHKRTGGVLYFWSWCTIPASPGRTGFNFSFTEGKFPYSVNNSYQNNQQPRCPGNGLHCTEGIYRHYIGLQTYWTCIKTDRSHQK